MLRRILGSLLSTPRCVSGSISCRPLLQNQPPLLLGNLKLSENVSSGYYSFSYSYQNSGLTRGFSSLLALNDLRDNFGANGFLADIRECEEILEDMVSWDKLLPDNIKKRVEAKFNEIGDRVQQGELGVEDGYGLFKEFEDQMVEECKDLIDAEGPPQFNETNVPDKKEDSDDPPGEGPILRWHTFVVMAPGVDARHPKNKKVKMSVTVKELGLSKHQFRRFRELVGKRYHPGKDELTIVSERFEHREENRKDCLRTLLNIIEEAGKADKIVKDALTSHLKEKLKSNPRFMGRLNAKKTGIQPMQE